MENNTNNKEVTKTWVSVSNNGQMEFGKDLTYVVGAKYSIPQMNI
jgi:hypothetical protein